jgi:polyhydroxyalkanoate synthesis regulator phasin
VSIFDRLSGSHDADATDQGQAEAGYQSGQRFAESASDEVREHPPQKALDTKQAPAASEEMRERAQSGDEVAAARAEVERTRAEMSETVDALQKRLEPQRLKEQALIVARGTELLEAGYQSGQRFAESVGRFNTSAVEAGIEAWSSTAGLFFWWQDQAERATRMWLDQWSTAREQAQSLQAGMVEQIRRNQAEMQKMMQDAVEGNLPNAQQLQQSALDEMQRRMDEMTEQMEALRRNQAK